MENQRKYLIYIPLIFLFILMVGLGYLVYKSNTHNDYLKVVFLDVGQGDSIYIEAPNGKQMLIDAGLDAKVLSSLAKVMPFADRSIDMIIATHSDMDHIGGFPLLLNNYKVTSVIENGATSDSEIYSTFEEIISKDKINKIIAHRGMHIILDDGENIYFDILFPDRDVSNLDSNDGSIVGKLVYGENSFMFTGDANLYTENQIEWNESGETLESDVLKLGHHGSKTSSSILWLEKIKPSIAIVSAGKNNKYGHPDEETIERLKTLGIPFLNTAEIGNIIFQSDGIKLIY
jgi:beta-lactamase superfamily II metal-dependent hydrolase